MMRNQNPQCSHNTKGFSIVELVVALGLFGIVASLMASQFSNLMKTAAKAERRQQVNVAANMIDRLLTTGESCTKSLEGLALDTNADPNNRNRGTKVSDLYYAVQNPALPGTFKKAGQPSFTVNTPVGQNITLEEIKIQVSQQIVSGNSPQFLAELQYKVKDDVDGQSFRITPTTVALTTNSSNVITHCATSLVGGNVAKEKLCDISSDGLKIYNPRTGECIDRYPRKWVVGDHRTAKCPGGHRRYVSSNTSDFCGVALPSGFSDNYPSMSRNYEGGRVGTASPNVALFDHSVDNSCTCIYASDVNNSAFRCKVACMDLSAPISF